MGEDAGLTCQGPLPTLLGAFSPIGSSRDRPRGLAAPSERRADASHPGLA
jgi:hypothetical protein